MPSPPCAAIRSGWRGVGLKALTLQQPWATLVAMGAKRIETRSWRTRYRGPLAIHAAAGLPPAARAACLHPPLEAALRAADVWPPESLPRGAVLAVTCLLACARIGPDTIPPEPERSFGDYAPGRWAWLLEDVHALPQPIPVRGALGLWEWAGST